ncbi:NAD(P)/FAD-dependent oxidoreductase [Streptomyces sp. P01-B04]|uniref:NAD(P)-binding protein n=1 Tax=Streptomyces poriferorum TaxID=2798799 RepID=UPI001C5DFE54|nr:FAD/NAD(P)-binding protein [Streptomyces poriferorum]MBW5248368.1 NAD(P)/FAD-dependent oxidoreductase [Streptomyces poriferorum]MBW5255650.1 NAD(P)/FAD-dependent oxidoreductase [Streptomyces poriferorum]
MNRKVTRRDFLDGVAVTAMGAAAAVALPGAAQAAPSAHPGPTPHGHGRPKAPYPPTATGLRGQQPGAYDVAHAVRDGAFAPGRISDTRETYDLVVVGGGLSGLAAAYLYRKHAGPKARVLILDALDDFGGHARRNEFHVGRTQLLSNGGTVNIDTPSTWSRGARDLLTKDLGVDLKALEATVKGDAYAPYSLRSGTLFNSERWGKDQLVIRESGESWASYATKLPMSEASRAALVRLYTTTEDFYPGLTDAQKKEILARTPYETYLREKLGLDADALEMVKRGTNGLWGVNVDHVAAADAWATGQPGFGGLGLEHTPWPGAGLTPLMHLAETEEDGNFYFPEGNASLARLLVSKLVPDAFDERRPDWQRIVTAKADYSRLDDRDNHVRIRLGSTAFHVRNEGRHGAVVDYSKGGQSYRVRAKGVVMACWNSVSSYVVPELPTEQVTAMRYGTKVPLVYARVALRDWRAFARARVSRVSTPSMFFSSFGLPTVTEIGDFAMPHRPELPTVVSLSATPGSPGLVCREQHKAGRRTLIRMPFEDFEREIRDSMTRSLGDHGFDPARDITAITVNRWAHGYAYEYNSLDDPSLYQPESQRPYAKARRPVGRITIANSDAEAFGYTHAAFDAAIRAVAHLL